MAVHGYLLYTFRTVSYGACSVLWIFHESESASGCRSAARRTGNDSQRVPTWAFVEALTRGLRATAGAHGSQQWQPLGEALEFDEAKRRAEDWISQFAGSSVRTVKRDTVIAALETYLTDLRRHDRADAAKTAEGRFKTALGFDSKARATRIL